MRDWQWKGARWWKFDFHAHTPASKDYGKGPDQAALAARTPREWLLDYMREGIDCVAVTDHNSGAWIDPLRDALGQLDDEQREGYRPLVIFPGVEISANGGVHILALFAPGSRGADVDTLLGAVGYTGEKGATDAVTKKSASEVVEAVADQGGIAIPAHADRPRGLFGALDGVTLGQFLDMKHVIAMEVIDLEKAKPALYVDKKVAWTEVLGSDTHHPTGQRAPGSHFTWVKMERPGLDGLRLALLDGRLSVQRSDAADGDPNRHAPVALESVAVAGARFMGRAQPLVVALNPWLNTVIGGRGTGKSTLVEFIRIALRREREIPAALAEEWQNYQRVYTDRGDDGLLAEGARLQVTYRKDDTRFRVQWSPQGDLDPILEEQDDGSWSPAEGDIAQRFPVRIYSQKQIFQLAREPLALLRIVDDAVGVDRGEWDERWREEEARFLSLRARAREIEAGRSDLPRLRGELEDVKRKLAVFETAGHAAVLRGYQRARRQQRAVESWDGSWTAAGSRIREVASDLVPEALTDSGFDAEGPESADLAAAASDARDRVVELRDALHGIASRADEVAGDWQRARDASAWRHWVDAAIAAYEELEERLAAESAGDPAAYGELVQRRHTVEKRIEALAGQLPGVQGGVAR